VVHVGVDAWVELVYEVGLVVACVTRAGNITTGTQSGCGVVAMVHVRIDPGVQLIRKVRLMVAGIA